MFKQASTPKFWAPVKVDYPKEDGTRGTLAFDVQFKRVPAPEVRAMAAANDGADNADFLFLQEVVTDWRKVTDDDGAEVPFSVEALQQLVDIGFGRPVVQTFFQTLPQAKQKN